MTGNRATNLQNRVTGNRLVMVLAMLLVLGISGKSYAGWPFNRTPAIEGRITDATTGAPIENVIVACGWQKSVPSFGGDVTSSFTSEVCVTGKDGRYKIPAKTTFHLYSSFHGARVHFTHPLYESKMEYGDNNGIMVDHVEVNKSSDGIVHADIRLMGLRERYLSAEGGKGVTSDKSQVTSEEEGKKMFEMGSSFWSYLSAADNGWYWLTLKEKNIPFDLEETFKVWDEIGERYSPYYGDFSEKLGRTKEQIRGKVGNE